MKKTVEGGDVIIYVRGGVVQDVISNREGLRAMLVDYDDEAEEPVLRREFQPVGCAPELFAKTMAGTETGE